MQCDGLIRCVGLGRDRFVLIAALILVGRHKLSVECIVIRATFVHACRLAHFVPLFARIHLHALVVKVRREDRGCLLKLHLILVYSAIARVDRDHVSLARGLLRQGTVKRRSIILKIGLKLLS